MIRQVEGNRPPSLAAIVPASDNRDTLARCLAAIRGAREPPDEVIAVTEPRGSGAAAARNAGAARAASEVLVFIDSDVIVHDDAFVRLRRAFADPGLSAVFGSYDETPEATGVVSGFRNLLHHHIHQTSAGRAATFWCGLGAVRRGAFERVGGFDERLFSAPSVEDIDLGLRLNSSGFVTLLDPELQGTHLKRWSLPEMVRVDFARRGMPWIALLLRAAGGDAAPSAPRPAGALNLSWRHRLSALASLIAAVALALRRPRAAIMAMAALIGLNRGFYALLASRLGPHGMAAGVVLHLVHHLTALAAAPAGLVLYLRWRRSDRPSSSRAQSPAR